MATHSDGTLEYWHATSRQLLFQKKVLLASSSMTKCCRHAKSAQLAATMHLQGRWVGSWWVSWTRERHMTWKVAIWAHIKTGSFVWSGTPSTLTSCWVVDGTVQCTSGTSESKLQWSSSLDTTSVARLSTSAKTKCCWETTSLKTLYASTTWRRTRSGQSTGTWQTRNNRTMLQVSWDASSRNVCHMQKWVKNIRLYS